MLIPLYLMQYKNVKIRFLNFEIFENYLRELEHAQTNKPNALTHYVFLESVKKGSIITIHF